LALAMDYLDNVRLHKIYERLMLEDVPNMHRIVEVEENEVSYTMPSVEGIVNQFNYPACHLSRHYFMTRQTILILIWTPLIDGQGGYTFVRVNHDDGGILLAILICVLDGWRTLSIDMRWERVLVGKEDRTKINGVFTYAHIPDMRLNDEEEKTATN